MTSISVSSLCVRWSCLLEGMEEIEGIGRGGGKESLRDDAGWVKVFFAKRRDVYTCEDKDALVNVAFDPELDVDEDLEDSDESIVIKKKEEGHEGFKEVFEESETDPYI